MKPLFINFGERKKRVTHNSLLLAAELRNPVRTDPTERNRLYSALIEAVVALDTEPEVQDGFIYASGEFERIRRRRALRACQAAIFQTANSPLQ